MPRLNVQLILLCVNEDRTVPVAALPTLHRQPSYNLADSLNAAQLVLTSRVQSLVLKISGAVALVSPAQKMDTHPQ
jgi:hypothetical protein